MLLLQLFIYIAVFVALSSSNERCPFVDFCSCSADLTIVKCNNRQLTNGDLIQVNKQLTNTTIFLNLSSNSLTSIKSLPNLPSLQILDLSFNKIRYLSPILYSKFPRLISLCIRNLSLKTLPKPFKNHSTIHLHLPNSSPQTSTILFENNRLILNCSSSSPHYWTQNQHIYPPTIIASSYSILLFPHLQSKHSGVWTCQNSHSNHSISVTILTNSSHLFCPSKQMNTSKGYFIWPQTFLNQRIELPCPHGSAAWLGDGNQYARASHTCSSNGQWTNFDVSQCGYRTNISRQIDRFSLNEKHFLLHLVKYLTEINRNAITIDDILLLIDFIADQQMKSPNSDRMMLIYHLTDLILQIQSPLTSRNDEQSHRAMNRLRSIIERLLDLTNQSWLYIGKELTAMTLQSPSSSSLCFVPNRSLLTIHCQINDQAEKSSLMTLAFPFNSNITNQYSLFRIIVYRHSTIFPSYESIEQNNNPVVYLRPVSTNSVPTIRLTFSDLSGEGSIGVWNTNETIWQRQSSICTTNSQNDNLISTDCILSKNTSLAITYFHYRNDSQNLFFNRRYSQMIITISSVIASFCCFTSILFSIYFDRIFQIPRRHFHCLINYWFSLAILLPLFALANELRRYRILCQIIGIILHYLSMVTIIWLTLLTYSIWRKLYVITLNREEKRKSSLLISDDETKDFPLKKPKDQSIIQFYLFTYGIAFIICGMNIVITPEQHSIHSICYLNHFDSMLLLLIPILFSICLLLVFLLLARNYMKNVSLPSSVIPNETAPILNSSDGNDESSSSETIDHQYESINQLLSILSQLILLIFVFLSSLTIYFRPLHSMKLRFEHLIYSHCYGFFVIFLAFYILCYHVLSRLRRVSSERIDDEHHSIDNKECDLLSSMDQTSIVPLSSSHDYSQRYLCHSSPNMMIDESSKRLTNVTSKYYIQHEQILKTNSSQSIRCIPSMRDTINDPIKYLTIPTKSLPLHSSSLILSRSFLHSPISPSQAIIRSIPIVRLSLQNPPKTLSNSIEIMQSNDDNSDLVISLSSTEEYQVLTTTDQVSEEKSIYGCAQVLYIDEDDERSVSLKSYISDSRGSSGTMLTKKNHSQTLSLSASSSSSTYSHDFHPNSTKIHESSV